MLVGKKRKPKVHIEKPVSVLDVAAYIIKEQPKKQPLTAWKLQKLVYYCQAWSLVWDEKPLFRESILAWANGPVVRELYQQHKRMFYVKDMPKGSPNNLSANQKDTIDHVLNAYGDKTAQWLSDLTHLEDPWKEARKGLKPGERGDAEIKLSLMLEYYSAVDLEGQPINNQ
ncbi:MAG TPA: type II toxin-antitoxin system antitoxin SocA domain-containing protein [Chlamydiales bacterium]|nr:type II toxin-antitoxin system antitoxin SocA domain-containing protein [Chlamydiales bacterium]